MTSTDVAKHADNLPAGVSPEQYQALMASQESEFDANSYQVPILKVGQPLTREVTEDEADAGDFINTLTGEALGSSVGFIVSYYQTGRALGDRKSGRYYVAFGDTIPASWEDAPGIGPEYVGTPFVEHPDAEEIYKQRANDKEIEWGHGPPISTTHNYTGLVVVSPEEDAPEDAPDEVSPVRLTLKRTDMNAVRKINSIKKAVLHNRPFWEIVYDLSTFSKRFAQGVAYNLNVKQGRPTTAEEREVAVELALHTQAGRVVANDADASDTVGPAPEPKAQGGLAV